MELFSLSKILNSASNVAVFADFFLQKKSYIQTRGGTPPPLFVIKTHNIVFDPLKQQQESIKNIVHIFGDSVLGRDSERVKSWSGQIWRGWQRARWKSEWGAEWSGGEVKKDWSDEVIMTLMMIMMMMMMLVVVMVLMVVIMMAKMLSGKSWRGKSVARYWSVNCCTRLSVGMYWDWVQGGDPLYAAVFSLSSWHGHIWPMLVIFFCKKRIPHI